MDNIGKAYYQILGDDYGYVALEGTLPDPLRGFTLDDWVVKGARVSYRGKTKDKTADAGLIRRLLMHDHSSPSEQPHMTFSLRAPMAVIVHLLRHRSAHINGESSRFKAVKDEQYIPQIWRRQSLTNKQLSEGAVEKAFNEQLRDEARVSFTGTYHLYNAMLNGQVGREQARLVLPTDAMYKSYVITIDLRNFLHFIGLRAAPDAQPETQSYACAMYWLIAGMAPLTVAAWRERLVSTDPNFDRSSVGHNLDQWRKQHGEPEPARHSD